MRFRSLLLLFTCLTLVASAATASDADWHVLFDGSGLEGWRSNQETRDVFSVTDAGELKVEGGRAHLFWLGRDGIPARFKDFEFQAKVKTTEGSNSGLFFHTEYQASGWPGDGLEAQINSSHKDRRKTGSLYAVSDVLDDAPSKDGEWFDYLIRVEGKTVTVRVDGKVVNSYTEATPPETPPNRPEVRLGDGLFAIQGHDPKSTIYLKDIRVRTLP